METFTVKRTITEIEKTKGPYTTISRISNEQDTNSTIDNTITTTPNKTDGATMTDKITNQPAPSDKTKESINYTAVLTAIVVIIGISTAILILLYFNKRKPLKQE